MMDWMEKSCACICPGGYGYEVRLRPSHLLDEPDERKTLSVKEGGARAPSLSKEARELNGEIEVCENDTRSWTAAVDAEEAGCQEPVPYTTIVVPAVTQTETMGFVCEEVVSTAGEKEPDLLLQCVWENLGPVRKSPITYLFSRVSYIKYVT